MKKCLIMVLTMLLVVTMSAVVCAESKVVISGEANMGYDFDEIDNQGGDGANFSNYKLALKTDLADNVSFYSRVQSKDVTKTKGTIYFKDFRATLKFDPVELRVGYYGFGFGNYEDILDVASGDFKARLGVRATIPFAQDWNGQLYLATKSEKDNAEDQKLGNGAYAVCVNYNKDKFGGQIFYADPKWDGVPDDSSAATKVYSYDSAQIYAVNLFYKPISDLVIYLENCTVSADLKAGTSLENTNSILGALYTPANSPFEFRVEYDIDNENEFSSGWTDFNPWGFRVDYKLKPNARIEMNRNECSPTSSETSIKLKLEF
jgi:hypothetical protein